MRTVFQIGSVIPLSLCVCLGSPSVSWGQKPPPPVPPNPQAPVLAMPAPMGMQRGTTMDLVLTGANLAGPTALWTGFPSKITIPAEDKNSQDNSKLKVRLEVPADAPLGYHAVRLATARGISNIRIFCIDELPQVIETGMNRTRDAAQQLPVPCVVAGRTEAEQSSFFKITVPAGQRLSFDVLGHRLGGPIDPQLSLYSAKTGREIAYDNDSPGCQTDPRLTYHFKEAGDYLIEVKDVLNRGGADYGYRLRIGDFPLATVPIPMAAKRGSKVQIQFAGPNVEGVAPIEVAVPADPAVNVIWLAPKGPSGLHGWPVALALSDLEETIEQEPNNEPAKANRIPVPGAVTGRFQQSDDTDCYLFDGKKGQKLLIEAHTLELYSPTLVYMVLKNAKTGAEIAKTDPQKPPPTDQRLEFTPPEDGDYLLDVQHINLNGGPSEVYRITVTPSLPGFDVSLGLERYDLAAGALAPIQLVVNRRGYAGPIDVSVVGSPTISGAVTIKAGQNASVLPATAKPDAPMGPHIATLLAKATIDGKQVSQLVSTRVPISQSLAGLPFPPLHLNDQVAVAIRERAPFALAVAVDPPEATPGMPTQVTITVKRDPGFMEEIAFNPPAGLPPNLAAPKIPNIAKDKNELKFSLDVNAKVPLGEFPIFFTGKAKVPNKEFLENTPPFNLLVGSAFELKVEPAVVTLKPGDKAKVKISATRKAGYKGPIALDLRKLPPNVTAGKATIAMDQATAEVEVMAAANAAPGETKDVDALGVAAPLANQQNASPAFTVRVEKK
ncbi:MAG: PPC domain-containing protein [Planctomycetes bacterium]|nr:PPC domain-containing protein [Planctomycetota bacterium]